MKAKSRQIFASDCVVLGAGFRPGVLITEDLRASAIGPGASAANLTQLREHLITAATPQLEQQERVTIERVGEDELDGGDMRARVTLFIARAREIDLATTAWEKRGPALREHAFDVAWHVPRQ